MRVNLDWDYHTLAQRANETIRSLTAAHPQAATLYVSFLADAQVLTLWDMTAYMAVEQMGFNDHGQMHAQIVAANALQLLHLFQQAGLEPDVVTSGGGTFEDAAIVVLAAALLHDIGNQVAREHHELYGVFLAQPVLARLLPPLYGDPVGRQVITSFILSAIASHDCTPPPLTREGALVAVADAADITRGRGQVAFDRGKADIHAISAMAVERVSIQAGAQTPAHIEVEVTNPAGLFQVEKLLVQKILLARLEAAISLRAATTRRPVEDALVPLVLRQGRLALEAPRPAPLALELVDPVCGMKLTPSRAASCLILQEVHYYFCSNACLSRFQADPARYAPASPRLAATP